MKQTTPEILTDARITRLNIALREAYWCYDFDKIQFKLMAGDVEIGHMDWFAIERDLLDEFNVRESDLTSKHKDKRERLATELALAKFFDAPNGTDFFWLRQKNE